MSRGDAAASQLPPATRPDSADSGHSSDDDCYNNDTSGERGTVSGHLLTTKTEFDEMIGTVELTEGGDGDMPSKC